MAFEHDELNRRRQFREEMRKKREQEQRRMLRRLIIAGVVVLLCAAGIITLAVRSGSSSKPDEATEPDAPVFQPQVEVTEEPTEERYSSLNKAPTVIHLAAAGDLNITDKTVWAGQTSGDFDYTKAFMDVAPIFAQADLALLNFEGTASGAPYGTKTASAPQQMLEALKRAGIDVVQMANSYSIYNGMIGLETSLANMRAAGIEPIGAFSNPAEFQKTKGYTICEVDGIKIALVAFTKGMGSLGLPAGSESCVNVLYKDYATTYRNIDTEGITKILKNVASENPDITIALLHWGSEYNDTISDSQKDIARLMKKQGVDAIIGNHSHMVHEITYDETTGQLVAYSLGDFFGDGSRGGTNYSLILDLEITKDYDTGETSITDYSYTPIYILAEDECDGDRRVVRIENAISAYEGNFIDKITKTAYENMQTSLKRIQERIQGK